MRRKTFKLCKAKPLTADAIITAPIAAVLVASTICSKSLRSINAGLRAKPKGIKNAAIPRRTASH